MSQAKVLLAEDDDTLAQLLARVLKTQGYSVDVIASADEMPNAAKVKDYDVVLSDIHLANGTSGHDVLKRVREVVPRLPVVLMTAFADIEGAMTAVSHGAYDYLPKPIEPRELSRILGEAVKRRKLAEGSPKRKGPSTEAIVGSAPAMIDLYKTVAHVAGSTATVLISGESGTGKELVAHAIHSRSPRAQRPFVAVNCAALPESILESELFGHEKGAFTGAIAQKRGLFEEANGGTLFLDEVGDVPPKMQAQLLRALERGEIRRVGGRETITVDVRLVAATNRDLQTDVASGRFREDLYFRLQVVTVNVPPLRARAQDIPLLVTHFLALHAERLDKPVPNVAPDAIEALGRYAFPGNVRELSHVIERAMLLARDGVITASELPHEFGNGAAAKKMDLADDWPSLGVLERRYIDRVLSRTNGNKTRAAEILGIDRRTLNRMFARERAAAAEKRM